MKLALWWIDKTKHSFVMEGIETYTKRINRFHKLTTKTFRSPATSKHYSTDEIKLKEGSLILSQLNSSDVLIVLDEKGKSMDSMQFAKFVEGFKMTGQKRIIFLIGGAYGFSPDIYTRAQYKLQLSSMTFSHQLIRVIFLEQLYRAMTIINNTPYHNI